MVVAPAVAFGAPDSGSDTTGAASDPAAPAKPTKQHKPAKAHTEKKAVGAHKDKVEDQPSEPKADPTDADPRAGDGTGAHTEPGGQGPSTSVATADEDAVDGAKEAAAQDVPVTIA